MFLTDRQIESLRPEPPPPPGVDPRVSARETMLAGGLWGANQQMGMRWSIGCVALEITQRCNLDCSICYLSEHSEAVRDLPLPEVLRRAERIHAYYGNHTDVQITGGEPTLRRREELLAIVAHVRALGMRPTLMTNGRRLSRELLSALAEAGLCDVVFHVDTTLSLKGYDSEAALNALRQEYIELARGLPVSVMFNTTVHGGNLHEIPQVAAFFVRNADVVRTAAFQLQADTGRGLLRERAQAVTLESVTRSLRAGAGVCLNFDASRIGHPSCSRYGLGMVINGNVYDVFDDAAFIARMQPATADLVLDRGRPGRASVAFLRRLLVHPSYWFGCWSWLTRKLWRARRDLVAARGHIDSLSFVVHNFMGACELDPERIAACVFKVMTADGPLSMCLHNARRDRHILTPIPLRTHSGKAYWHPLTGVTSTTEERPPVIAPDDHPLKRLRGRSRQRVLVRRRGAASAPSSSLVEEGRR